LVFKPLFTFLKRAVPFAKQHQLFSTKRSKKFANGTARLTVAKISILRDFW
jgi:hypothetical protein